MRRFRAGAIAASLAFMAGPALAQGMAIFVAPSGRVYTAPKDQPYPSAAWFTAIDTNADGAVSSVEFAADFAAYFETLDGDRDGVLSIDEVKEYANGPLRGIVSGGGAQTRFDRPVARVGDDSGTDTAQEQLRAKLAQQALSSDLLGGAGRYGIIALPQPVASMDMDFDGRISRAEMRAAASRRYKLLTPDGKPLTRATLPRTPAQRD